MKVVRSYREMRQAEVKTVGWFFAAMALTTLMFAAAVAGHYLFGW